MAAKKKMISTEEAEKLMGNQQLEYKPQAKGKLRQTEIKADEELEGRMTDAQTKTKKPKHDDVDPRAVGGGALRGVMQETFARVYEEIWPGMETRDHKGDVDIEIKEEVYILCLTMKVGNDEDKPRRGLKMREVEDLGDTAPLCKEHGG